MSRAGLVLGAVAVVACGCARTARFYPANEAATGGVLQARFTPYGLWRAEMTLALPDGEILQGEASIERGAPAAAGPIFAAVYGVEATPYTIAYPGLVAVPAGSPGIAALRGDRGTTLACEFFADDFTGRGHGACRSSRGALYRMQY